jgi:hypothetical protein
MKKLVTFRLDGGLLEMARWAAAADNRTLTNFVETALLARIGQASARGGSPRSEAGHAEAAHG